MNEKQTLMVYIAAPYWHDDENIRNYRRRKAIEYSELLFRKGILFYSPLLYSERFAKNKTKENYWVQHGIQMVSACQEMRVLCLDGWEDSNGIKGEIAKAESLKIPIKYIEKHSRISFHGSRSLSLSQCKPIILSEIEKHQPDTIVTHGEPSGACGYVRQIAREEGIALKLHHLQHHRLAGQFHWRSTAVLDDSEHAIFLHDGISQGTTNELALSKKLGVPFTYYRLKENKLVLAQAETEDAQDYKLDLLEDEHEKGITKAVRTGAEYQRFRKAVLDRDGHKCMICGDTEKLCVHHLIPFSKSDTLALDPGNGQTLCEEHHNLVHGKLR
jgi:hypothetical protein